MSLIPPGTAPGITVNVSAAPVPGTSNSSTGAFFVAGLSQRGPVGVPVLCTSLQDFINLLGTRYNGSPLYDAAEVYFSVAREAGILWVARVVGPAATQASLSLKDSTSTSTLTVKANGPGSFGNSLKVAVVAGATAGTYQLVVSIGTTVVETSPQLVTTTDAVNWGTLSPAQMSTNASKYITVTDLGVGTQPEVAAATALTGGTDDDSNASDAQFTTALAVFSSDLGPGQVAAPGRTTTATYGALNAHGATNNRWPLYDGALGASASTLATAAAAAQGAGVDTSYGQFLAGWTLWPGFPTGTAVAAYPRQVPPSAAAAGLMAANDLVNDCNVAAAGGNGIVQGALGVVTAYSAADRATLQAAGVCPFVKTNAYPCVLRGWVTLATDPQWQDASSGRFRMQLVADFKAIGETFEFAQIDGPGIVFGAFNGQITDKLNGYYSAGSLYGATAAQAFSVDTGSTVNTPTTIANRQINAAIAVCMSPSNQWVVFNLTKYAVGQTIPGGTVVTTSSLGAATGN